MQGENGIKAGYMHGEGISSFRTILTNEDVKHWKNLPVVGNKRLTDEALSVRSLVARHQCLQYLEHLHDHSLLARVESSCERRLAGARRSSGTG